MCSGVRLPSLYLSIYRGKGGGGGAPRSHLGGDGQDGATLDGFWPPNPLGALAPKAKGAAALGRRPTSSGNVGRGLGGAQPLGGLVGSLP